MTDVPESTDWRRVATALAHRLIAAGEMERACAELDELAEWERQEGENWTSSDGAHPHDAARAYEAAAALLRAEDAANPFMRPRGSALG